MIRLGSETFGLSSSTYYIIYKIPNIEVSSTVTQYLCQLSHELHASYLLTPMYILYMY